MAGWTLHRQLGAFVPVWSVVRVAVATVAAIAVGRVIPFESPILSLVEAVGVGAVFLIVLVATGELGKKDLSAIAAVRKKRGTGEEA